MSANAFALQERAGGQEVVQATDSPNPITFIKWLIASGRVRRIRRSRNISARSPTATIYGAYMINWNSNVFPGILGRTCDRPCEPACRRGRVEEEPVAICRLKRVAADSQGRHRRASAEPPATRNGKRIACVGAGPASLTVARDLAAIGYEVTVFNSDRKAGGMMRSQIPKFRLPDEVIDEEVGYALSTGAAFVADRRIDSLKAPARRGLRRDLRRLWRAARTRPRYCRPPRGRRQHPYRHRLARQRLVWPCRDDRPKGRRARRRQHRHGLLPHLAASRRRRRSKSSCAPASRR